jgi:hypothetical protein
MNRTLRFLLALLAELEPEADRRLTHDGSTNVLIRRHGRSEEPPHGR